MRPRLRAAATAALLGGLATLGLLAGCTDDRAVEHPVPPTPLPTSDAGPPLGLDVRFVDADGRFRTLHVDDFPR